MFWYFLHKIHQFIQFVYKRKKTYRFDKSSFTISIFYNTMAINLSEPLLTILVTVLDNLYLVLSGIIESFA